MERLESLAIEYGQLALNYLSQTSVLVQLGLIGLLFFPALLLSRKVEPLLEERARNIKGMPGLLRVIIAFLRRFEWLFYVLLLALAYVTMAAAGWPADTRLVYAAMLLSGSWLLISAVSHALRSRTVSKIFAVAAWVYVAALIFGVVDDVAALLDGAGFSVGSFRLSILGAIKAAFIIGLMLWLSLSVGNFVDGWAPTVLEKGAPKNRIPKYWDGKAAERIVEILVETR